MPSVRCRIRWHVLTWLCATSLAISGQTPESQEIRHDDQKLILVSTYSSETEPLKTDGFEISIQRRGDAMQYVAKGQDSEVRSKWFSSSDKKPWIVFGTGERKFNEVNNRIRVELNDSVNITKFAEEFGAIRSKHYDGLGYAVLWFEHETNPFEVVKRLRSDLRVRHAELQFKRPRSFPL